MEYTPLTQLLQEQAYARPKQPAIIVPGKPQATKSFLELENAVVALAKYFFTTCPIKPGTRVVVAYPPSFTLIAALFALLKIGAIPIIIDPGLPLVKFTEALKTTQPVLLLGSWKARLLHRFFQSWFPTIQKQIALSPKVLQKAQNIATSTPTPPQCEHPEGLAAILFTSGSTGAPKGVCYKQRHFLAQCAYLTTHLGLKAGDIDLPLLPVFALFNPLLGITTVIPPINPRKPLKTLNPKKIANILERYQITSCFGAPSLWAKMLPYCQKKNKSFPALRRIVMAGCAVPPELAKAAQAITPNGTIYTPYGATEALPITIPNYKELEENISPLGSCVGKPIPGIEVKIIFPEDGPIQLMKECKECPPGEIGEIIVRGPIVTEAYANNPTATAKAKIKAHEAGSNWHRMGDLGFLSKKGMLYFCGRLIERIQRAEGWVSTEAYEAPLRAHPKIVRVALVGLGAPDKQIPSFVIEPQKAYWKDTQKAKAALLMELKTYFSTHSQLPIPQYWFFKKQLPVDIRHNAKIHRLTLAEEFTQVLESRNG